MKAAEKSPKLLARQRRLLLLLDALGGSVRNRDFQKLLFLYCQESTSGRPYDFVPYRFGAFSFTSYADRRKLTERGLLVEDEERWQLTDEGRCAVGGASDMHTVDFARRNRSRRGEALVAETYRRFPYYAIRSEIAERVLQGDAEAIARIKDARCKESAPRVFTIGYEGHTIESYLNVLLRSGVTLLCDVRRNPISRKYGFSKGAMARSCERVGIGYEHLRELGIASRQRQGLVSQEDYDSLFADYKRDSLPKQKDALATIAEWVRAGERVALTCFEQRPEQCHRHCVADALKPRLRSSAKHL